MNKSDARIQELRAQLSSIDVQREKVISELAHLQHEQLAIPAKCPAAFLRSSISFPDALVTKKSSEEDKISFFMNLFKVREDVFAERFESRKTGRSGYQPVCANQWKRPLCQKPKIKCSRCQHRILVPLSSDIIRNHLSGKLTVGGYALLSNEKCNFLAVDFDKEGWKDDARSFLQVCQTYGISPALERSRSGNGGHVWIFFSHEVPARTARQMGSFLLTETMDTRPAIGLDSYDRLFPNQDVMPKGGFGNLIALPLQRIPSKEGNSLFVDDQLRVYNDQWAFLSSLALLAPSLAEKLAEKARITGRITGIKPVPIDESADDPWTLPPSRKIVVPRSAFDKVPVDIRIILSDEIYIPKEKLPPALLNGIVRLAAFQNTEFYRAQAMKLPVYGKPRIIGCASDIGKCIGLPRGCLYELKSLLADWGINVVITDERNIGTPINLHFQGILRKTQEDAFKNLMAHDIGVLSASTAFGKTIVAIKIISARKVNTLIVVHRRQLMEQWIERLVTFLN